MPAKLASKRRHTPLNPPTHAVVAAKMIDKDNLARRSCYAREFAHDFLRLGYYRQYIHRDYGIECGLFKLQGTGIHFIEPNNIVEALVGNAFACLVEHFRGQIDADNLQMSSI